MKVNAGNICNTGLKYDSRICSFNVPMPIVLPLVKYNKQSGLLFNRLGGKGKNRRMSSPVRTKRAFAFDSKCFSVYAGMFSNLCGNLRTFIKSFTFCR